MSDIPDLTAHKGYLLRMVSNAVSQKFARDVEGEGVTVAEWAMLRSLYGSDATTPSDLVRKIGMTKGAISKLADRLLDKGLIARTGSNRGQSLSLSPAGAQRVPILAALADQNDAAFFTVLSGEEHKQLRDLLHGLIKTHGLTTMPVD